MTSDTNRPLDVQAFEPVEPEPAPSFEPGPAGSVSATLPDAVAPAATIQAGRPGGSRRTRLVVNDVLAAAIVVLVGGIAFAAGRATAPATAAADDAGNGLLDGGLPPGDANGQGPLGPGGLGDDDLGRLGPGLGTATIEGIVRAINADSMTIELADGGTIEIAIDSDTDYHRLADASASDVSTGTSVIVGVDGLRLRDGAGASAADVTIVP